MPVRSVVVAPDKFRGSATATEIVDAVAAALTAAGASPVGIPLADGGEGTVDAFGGPNRTTTVTGPLGDPVEAGWRLDRDQNRAVLEMAAASGLALVGGAEGNDPLAASTSGTGELIAEAADRGARRIIIGLGGSATTDGGLGAIRAMYPLARYRGIELVVATDVRTRFTDAPAVFGPQKGATPAQIKLLTSRLERLAGVYVEEHGVDVREMEGAGAAGGLAGGLAAIGAELQLGFACVAEEVELEEAIETTNLVITGEGRIDDTSWEGKVVGGVAEMARRYGRPVLAIGGMVDLSEPPPEHVTVVSLTERFGLEASMTQAPDLVAQVAAEWFGEHNL